MRCMTKQLSLVSISVLFIVFSVAVISAYSQEEQTRSSLAPEKVLRIGPNQEAINFRAVSKNGKLVLLGREGVESGGMRKSFYEVNGNPDRSYDSVTKPILSSDGNHYMYGARKNNKYWVVVDGKKEEGPYDGLGWGSAGYFEVGTGKFSPVGSGYDVLLGLYDSSSTHYAYMVKISNQWVIVVDGQRIPGSYEDIGLDFSFSPQGNKIAFWGKHRKGWTLFVNGEDIIGTLLKETKWYSFSPDWSQVLLSGRLADKLVIMYADITKQRASRWEIDDVKNPGPRRSPWSKDSSNPTSAVSRFKKFFIGWEWDQGHISS